MSPDFKNADICPSLRLTRNMNQKRDLFTPRETIKFTNNFGEVLIENN